MHFGLERHVCLQDIAPGNVIKKKKKTACCLLLCESTSRSLLDPFLVALFKPVAFIVRHWKPSREPGAGS